VRSLPQLGPEATKRAGPVALRAAGDRSARVRVAAVGALPQLLGSEAAPVLLRAAAEDNATSVRVEALQTLPKVLAPEAVEAALLRAMAEDEEPSVFRTAARMLRPEAAERAVLDLLEQVQCSRRARSATRRCVGATCWLQRVLRAGRAGEYHRARFQAVAVLAEKFTLLEPAALERAVPTLVMILESALSCMQWDNVRRLAANLVIKIGSALAGEASAYGLRLLDLLVRAEKVARSKDRARIRLSRAALQRNFEEECESSFLKQSGIVTHVSSLIVEIPVDVMIASGARGTEAHRCPNRDACSVTRRWKMTPTMANSTKVKECSCFLLLSAHGGNSSGATDELGSMCATGFDAASPGCATCLPGFGRKNSDPFLCEPCAESGRAEKIAAWLAQPLLLFFLALRSAENAAASKGVAAAVANDIVKIGLAYLSSVGVVVSAVTSTGSYHELSATDRAREMLNLARQARRGDVTHAASSDCLLTGGQGAASVERLLALSLQVPACVLATAAVAIVLRACCRAVFSGGTLGLEDLRAEAANGMVTCSLVAGNQFLPGVASACMRALPCFHTQKAVDGSAIAQFLVYEPGTVCRENAQHLGTCGLALLFTAAVGPAYWLALLGRRRGAQQAGPVRFLAGSYRSGFEWWEAGRLGKTMLIASVVTASPSSYCPLQQLMVCLLITVAFNLWHCSSRPYKYWVLNVVEAGSLFTLSVGMVFSGLLAGARWPLTLGFQSNIIAGIASLLILYFMALVGLWVNVKFFWTDDANEESLAEDGPATDQ